MANALAADIPVAQDSTVSPGVSTNFGSNSVVSVGGAAGSQGLILFDVASALPDGLTGANIARATLWLYVTKVDSSGTIDIYQGTNAPWGEYSVNGAGPAYPSRGAILASGFNINSPARERLSRLTRPWRFANGCQAGRRATPGF